MEKSKRFYLLVIPIFIFFSTISLKNSIGPDYIKSRYDPSYIFLMNSLNIANFHQSYFTIQPGITLQTMGAVSLRFCQLFEYPVSLAESVISNPETYLKGLEILLALVLAISLYLLGAVIYKYSDDMFGSMLLQLSPLVSLNMTYVAVTFSPDSILMSVTIIMLAYAIYFTYNSEPKYPSLIFGLISGFGLATKFSFFPLIIFPLFLLRGKKRLLLFPFFTLISFVFFMIPGILRMGVTFSWLTQYFVKSGKYGTGESNVVDTKLFASNILNLLVGESFFIWVLCFTIFSFAVLLFFRRKKNLRTKEFYLLCAIILTILLQILISAKQYTPRYMIPAFLLVLPGFYILLRYMSERFKSLTTNKLAQMVCFILVLFLLIKSSLDVKKFNKYSSWEQNECLSFIDASREITKESITIICYGSSSEHYALAFGINATGPHKEDYFQILRPKFTSDFVFYESYAGRFWTINNDKWINDFQNGKTKLFLQIRADNNNLNTLETVKKKLEDELGMGNIMLNEKLSNSAKEQLFEIQR